MSTSPDQPRNEGFFRRKESNPIPPPQVSPVRGLIWITAIIALIVLGVMYWEIVWGVISEFVPLALEFAEKALDGFFELIGLGSIAQMATAYTGVVLALVLFYVLLRKSITVSRRTRHTVTAYKSAYKELGNQWYATKREQALQWWQTLDWMQRVAAIGALVLIGIPLALLLSFVLGSLVTMLL